MKWIGLTGGIATGKSTVATLVQSAGIPVIDADKLAHKAIEKNQPGFAQVVGAFGKEIQGIDGQIDRSKLAAIVFSDSKKLHELESLLHPIVQKLADAKKAELKAAGHKMAVYDVPLLFEKNMQDQFDLTVVVSCSEESQKERLRQRDRMSDEEIEKRLQSQWPIAEKAKLADIVIDNSGTLEELNKKVPASFL